MERAAMSRMDDVWTTTEILRRTIGRAHVRLVPPGVAALSAMPTASRATAATRRTVAWAGRMSVDKNPRLFTALMRGVDADGVMHGSGPLEDEVAESCPTNTRTTGWTDPAHLFDGVDVFVSTAWREAFGRGVVEAAYLGIPLVLSSEVGAAPMLYTDGDLYARFVLDPHDAPEHWRERVRELVADPELRAKVGAHVQANARCLTIEASVEAIQRQLAQLVS
jgi:glycosyltransferase involved in cell wall biosynthesis